MRLCLRLSSQFGSGNMFCFRKGGGLTSVGKPAVRKYLNRINGLTQGRTDSHLIRSVQAFKREVEADSTIRMCLQGSLDKLAEANNPDVPLTGDNIDEVMQKINAVATNPPKFSDADIIGVPFSILFFGLLNNYYGQGFFGNPRVNHHLRQIFNDYGRLLKSKRSLQVLNTTDGWLCPQARQRVNYDDFICDPTDPHYGYDSWNDWFTRSLAPNARPVDTNLNRIVNSSDSYCLPTPQQPVRGVKAQDNFWLKDDRYSLYDMFGVKRMGKEIQNIVDESFVGGTVYQAFLSPWCYHRWHAPYQGKLEKSYLLPGTYLLEKPTSDLLQSGEDNYVNTQPMLTSMSVRQVFIIQTPNPLLGRIAVIEIGMGEVSSCNSIVNEGDLLEKGQELGRFEFGGSSHAIIFDRRAKLNFNPNIYEMDPADPSEPMLQKVNSWLAELTL